MLFSTRGPWWRGWGRSAWQEVDRPQQCLVGVPLLPGPSARGVQPFPLLSTGGGGEQSQSQSLTCHPSLLPERTRAHTHEQTHTGPVCAALSLCG